MSTLCPRNDVYSSVNCFPHGVTLADVIVMVFQVDEATGLYGADVAGVRGRGERRASHPESCVCV